MTSHNIKIFGNKLIILAFFIYALYLNGRLIAANYQLDQRLLKEKEDLAQMEEKNAKLKLLLSYYASDEYYDLEARRRLGLKKPDEKAYAVEGIKLPEIKPNEIEPVIYRETPEDAPRQENNLSSWMNYFFAQR